MISNTLYHAWAWLKHRFTAWNTGGEGIHSPYLFYLTYLIIPDEYRYYCWDAIEERRQAMLQSPRSIRVKDFGVGGKGASYMCKVSDIAKHSLESPRNAQVFFRIVNFMSEFYGRPLEILEFGTSLGITTAYLASVASRNRVTTYEGSGMLLRLAIKNWEALGLENITFVKGDIDKSLDRRAPSKFDVAFVDANHCYQATFEYVEYLAWIANESSVIIIDDIHYSKEMERAWKDIQKLRQVTTTMDYFDFGLVFFDSHYLKKHYRLRL